ncbi:helix-turn-helix domain-containing protein [Chitinophaga deserti]|uniref:helix-turn-helix domain-containing protein n=1 Tax=Chitinophaga deserti TaxID=2164099 RepID=UPI000D6C48DC|nr:AraC family transcriptional regulator [Chitinophaga deserti]
MESSIPVKNKIAASNHIKAEPFRKTSWKTDPHKHKQYFEIIFLTKGSGFHWIDGVQYEIRPNVLFFIAYDQVHSWDIQSDPEGFVLILKNSFTERSLDKELPLLIQQVSRFPCVYTDEALALHRIFELLTIENNATSNLSFLMKEGLIKALLAKILDSSDLYSSAKSVRRELYESFVSLLPEKPAKMKVADFAALLNTTPQNLNAACRKAVNQPAAEVIAEHITNEAKRLLRYTHKNVSEISMLLNFNDTSHFVKFFKRHTGTTPLQYKAQ